MSPTKLTLGPLLFHWEPEKRRDFYFRIADEAPVDCVYLGEVVCSKRSPFFDDYRQEVIDRLTKAGKEVVLSSLALLTTPREQQELIEDANSPFMVEANDVAAVQLLQGREFVVGPFINVLNEGAFDYLVGKGAKRIVFASEVNGKALGLLAGHNPAIETEVQIFGRQPVAVSMRCYHARAHGRDKDHCRFACGNDADGLTADTLDSAPILTINGTMTMSHGYTLLLDEALALRGQGITHFRLSPHDMDMVAVVSLFRAFFESRIDSGEVTNNLKSLKETATFINGFYNGVEGLSFVASQK